MRSSKPSKGNLERAKTGKKGDKSTIIGVFLWTFSEASASVSGFPDCFETFKAKMGNLKRAKTER